MVATDPDCGICRTITGADGTQWVIRHQFPKALVHHYPLPPLGADVVPVYRGKFDLEGNTYRGLIKVDLNPRPRLHAEGVKDASFEELHKELSAGGVKRPAEWVDAKTVKIPAKSVPSPAKTARQPKPNSAEGGSFHVSEAHLQEIVVGEPRELDYLTFFLMNGWYGHDGLNTCYDGLDRQGRIEVKLGEWQLRLEPRGDRTPKEVRNHQRSTGASNITHVGRIRRDDGTTFDGLDAIQVLTVVTDLVGFALGRVTDFLLPVGYRDSKAVWSQWACNRVVDRPLGATPFLDLEHTAEQMAELLQTGYQTSQNKARWEVFKNMLGYHYSAEHDATVNMKVLLPVSALQLISYAYLVEELPLPDPNHLSNKDWRNLDTSEQLRRILDLIGINLAVPSHMKHLVNVKTALEKEEPTKTFDQLGCVVRLRNGVAHPKQKDALRWSVTEWAETGFAATGMLHLAILWWLGFDGRYVPKTAQYRGAGDAVLVPWHVP
ncbi:hypothetical protein ACIA49_01310 [Kribbella sp. NPDC051587]|uniref:hypothetical protein n=1 Tax=Kribbella sp. NPDC051587 TaxID=3364119 RepID=UPI00379B60CA